MNKTIVMVFGVFDGIHEGHRMFLKQAKEQGGFLIAVVTQDHIVQHLKGHQPKHNLADRMAHLQEVDGVDQIIAGDMEVETWEIVKKVHPDIIAVGYDQEALKKNLEMHIDALGYHPEIRVMKGYEADMYHSSLLNE